MVANVPPAAAVVPSTVMTALLAGEADTVWSAPLVIIDGEIGSVAIAPDESDVVAVTTNCCNRPLSE